MSEKTKVKWNEVEVDLKPCPFCGESKLKLELSTIGNTHPLTTSQIACENCGAVVRARYPEDGDIKDTLLLVSMWNSRYD